MLLLLKLQGEADGPRDLDHAFRRICPDWEIGPKSRQEGTLCAASTCIHLRVRLAAVSAIINGPESRLSVSKYLVLFVGH
jgi:hypothetical protein